jgi:hypothetical protein
MKHALYVVAAAALLAACESAPVWQKAGASEATMKEDGATCHGKARLAPSTPAKPPPSIYASTMVLDADNERLRFEQEEFRRCMEEKGYSSKR